MNIVEIAIPLGMKTTLSYGVPTQLDSQIELGALVKVPLGKKEVWGVVWSLEPPNDSGDFKVKPLLEVSHQLRFPELSLNLLKWLSSYYQISPNRVIDLALSRDWAKLVEGKLPPSEVLSNVPLKPLKPHQLDAFEHYQSFDKSIPTLLFGITGSGKTRLYQEVIQSLPKGAKVLILVPEINLTPQTREAVSQGLNRRVDLWHSHLGLRQRRATYQAILSGAAEIILGTRSSLLLPHSHLDLIIMDEEHDSSYKQQDPAPRYHARELALILSKLSDCPLILGSATPSLESWNASQKGQFHLIKMKELAAGAGGAEWSLVDMKLQREQQGNKALSIPLREAIQKTVHAKRQVILLLNRRGFSRARVCVKCGEVQNCQDCQVPVVLHKQTNSLNCHYCARSYRVNILCSHCQSTEFSYEGIGIEQVEEELLESIEGIKLIRLDRDTTTKVGSSESILEEFKSLNANVLLGTQMVAKGHDFPNVDLVGVVNADTGLQSPDFRASERNYQLLTQVAGRTGRHNNLGEKCQVILQTFQPEHPLFKDVQNQDFEGFIQGEMGLRNEVLFPPFMKMALVEITSQYHERAQKVANQLVYGLSLKKDLVKGQVYGPIEAPISRIKKKHRIQIMLKSPYANQLVWWIDQVLKPVESEMHYSVQLKWDMDPYSMI